MTPRLLPLFWDTPVQPVHSDAVQALAGGTLSALKPPPTGRCWWKQKGLQIYVLKFLTDSQILLFSDYSKTNNILEFLIIHCLINTALMKTLHQLYIPRQPTTPTAQAGADKVLIQCLQSVHLEVHLDVSNENLHHMYIPCYHAHPHPPPSGCQCNTTNLYTLN